MKNYQIVKNYQMKKSYQWNNATLRKKSQLYGRLSLVFGFIALIVWMLLREASTVWLLVLLLGVVVCYGLSEWILAKDKRLKPKDKQETQL